MLFNIKKGSAVAYGGIFMIIILQIVLILRAPI